MFAKNIAISANKAWSANRFDYQLSYIIIHKWNFTHKPWR